MFRRPLASVASAVVALTSAIAISSLFGGVASATPPTSKTVGTWQVAASCGQPQSTVAPVGAHSVTIVTTGGGGGSGSGQSAEHDGGGNTTARGSAGRGSTVTVSYGIYTGQQITAETGCAGAAGVASTTVPHDTQFGIGVDEAGNGGGTAGGGGVGGAGWSRGGNGGNGTSCSLLEVFGTCVGTTNAYGGAGGGGGSSAVCLGPTCAASGTPAVVASGGGGSGQSIDANFVSGGPGGDGGSASNTTSTDGTGAGRSGAAGTDLDNDGDSAAGGVNSAGGLADGGIGIVGVAGFFDIGLFSAAAGNGGGGAGYVGGAGSVNGDSTANGVGGGGGGGSSYAYTNPDSAVSFGSSTGNGSVTVTFSTTVLPIPAIAVQPPASTPGTPTVGAVTPGNASALVTWTVPANNGSVITGFIITPYANGVAQAPIDLLVGAVGSALDPTPGAHDSYLVTGLINGDTYTFTVTAVNGQGSGPPSTQTTGVTPTVLSGGVGGGGVPPSAPGGGTVSTPGTPTVGAVTPGNASALVTWTVPANNGSVITGFIITPYANGVAQAPIDLLVGAVGSALDPTPGAHDSYLVTGLINGDTYTFTVTAVNGQGSGPPSTQTTGVTPTVLSGGVTPPPTLPAGGAPGAGNKGQGYWTVASDGGVFTFGNLQFYGSTGAIHLNRPIVGMASTPDDGGYWLVASDGGIFAFGDAQFYGSTGGLTLNKPIAGMTSTPDGKGYWLVASDGGIFAFGDAGFYGSTGAITLNKPIVAMSATPDGKGYWLVASDGGIFAFGDAQFRGSTASIALNRPVVGMTPTADGGGYWLVASDGGIFAFGDAGFYGSTGAITLNKPIVGMATAPGGKGYWLDATDGGIFAFGDANFHGSMGGSALNQPMVGMAI